MPSSWLTVLQAVPWGDVIRNAPKVADGARKLWKNVAGKDGAPAPDTGAPAGAAPSLAELQTRLVAAEQALAELHQQMLASSEIIQALAEQNTQLVQRVEAHRVRVRWLTAGVLLLAVALLGGMAMVIAR